jgi:hypothetical protein
VNCGLLHFLRSGPLQLPEFRRANTSVAEPHHFYAAPGPGYDAAPAATLMYNKAKFVKRTKHMLELSGSFDSIRFTYCILLKI